MILPPTPKGLPIANTTSPSRSLELSAKYAGSRFLASIFIIAKSVFKPGEKGILFVKGTNVMKGYYLQEELTASAFDEDGYFNTGDIAIQTYNGELMIRGRKKDTIVLRSGENVEPFPIEAKLAESPYIQQAVVAGQDENTLGALIIPNKEALRSFVVGEPVIDSCILIGCRIAG